MKYITKFAIILILCAFALCTSLETNVAAPVYETPVIEKHTSVNINILLNSLFKQILTVEKTF